MKIYGWLSGGGWKKQDGMPSGSGNNVVLDDLTGVTIFPNDNQWNTDVTGWTVHPDNAAYLTTMQGSKNITCDFSANLYLGNRIGIPFNVVSSVEMIDYTFDFAAESDSGQYPDASLLDVEDAGDKHLIVVHTGENKVYEIYNYQGGAPDAAIAGSGAIWDLSSNRRRPFYWTSADAAGLAIFPGLVRYDEAATGTISHAIRFTTTPTSQRAWYPATHYSGLSGVENPYMGMRIRLKSAVDLSGYSTEMQAVGNALKTYGGILADNGGDWFFNGEPNDNWNQDDIDAFEAGITGNDFEIVYEPARGVPPQYRYGNPRDTTVVESNVAFQLDFEEASGNFFDEVGAVEMAANGTIQYGEVGAYSWSDVSPGIKLGSGDYVGSAAALPACDLGTSDFVIEWIAECTSTTQARLIDFWAGASDGYYVEFDVENNTMHLYLEATDSTVVDATWTNVTRGLDGELHKWRISGDRDGNARFFIDGDEQLPAVDISALDGKTIEAKDGTIGATSGGSRGWFGMFLEFRLTVGNATNNSRGPGE